MREDNVVEIPGREGNSDPLTELLRSGARDLIQRAVESELAEYLEQYSGHRTAEDNAGVVRNGYLPERQLQTGLGPVPWPYLKGITSGEMGSALEVLLGPQAKGLVGEYRAALEAGVGARIPRLERGRAG